MVRATQKGIKLPKPIVLDTMSWRTQKDALEYFQSILHSYDINDEVTDPVHDLALREVIERHPDRDEKVGAGIDHFYIGRTRDGDKFNVRPDARGIWIKRTDGTVVDFSYITAIKNHTPKSDAKEALRSAIDDLRIAYRARRLADGTMVSDVSGTAIVTRDMAHVVYLVPAWEQLTYRFAESEGGWDKILVHSGHGTVKIGTHLLDKGVYDRWRDFFVANARPALATASENARRLRSDETAWTP